jgi:O-antigen ligase
MIDGILAVDYMEGLLLVMMIGCLFNSLLLDAGEGKFFCFMTGIILSSYFPPKSIKKP